MLKFFNRKERIAVLIRASDVEKAMKLCNQTRNFETGGILIGYYSNNYRTANITFFSKPPEDSKGTFNSFVRGFKKLKEIISFFFSANKHYYIGEWHYHPVNNAICSNVDIEQIKKISKDTKIDCKEPILVIISKENIGCYVFKNRIVLLKKSKGNI